MKSLFSLLIVMLSLWISSLSFAADNTFPSSLPDKLRVCADPNNLPYSNREQQGFENKIAEQLGDYFGLDVEYVWFPQRMGFIRNTLKNWSDDNGRFACDLVIGVPVQFDIAATTKPYYRSAYSLLYKKEGALAGVDSQQALANLPDEVKQSLKVAAFTPSPVVSWLRENGFKDNTEFFRIMNGDPEDYPGKMVKRVADGEYDVLVIWGPIAGYFAQNQSDVAVVPMTSEGSKVFDFAISMGVRYGERPWKETVEMAMDANAPQIAMILQDYGVPVVEASSKPRRDDDDD
ncbi:quinoprotein dehydrogenase-associated putative ABC transporter substrate-binding protein [Grimontia sp. NTOU-MAR1]|uniref:quinoprotein dehydrogenase-associated putative ABC transporter substrate-binding protein n=1 Tax=Grimontia sp. NTOU-MAR1 TaxID=3111011 RepID=UPI002DBB50FB|nr:quinoprotein dehydrogenase-associated putative ABC transporter substrate-binding protein [Grimontia sp. NTOU-MAR1]WRV96352.1 quinoprotein dehydrogenase-associated putative ABC transporter substrate-binding protein [Grimontia sp. NTOU-MAR1]